MARDPLTERWTSEQVEVLHDLRRWAAGTAELTHHLGRWMGLPSTDADALSQVLWAAEAGEPVSPADLSRHTGLSSGATSALVDRLERAGHVVRSRESADRRRVTLRPVPATRERFRAFLAFAGTEVAAAIAAATPEELAATSRFVARLTAAGQEANRRLAGAAETRRDA